MEWALQYATYIWDFVLAVIFTVIGMVFSQNQLGKREKTRVLEELTSIQRDMHRRATSEWQGDGQREVWMIGLYFDRVSTLRDLLNDRDKMPTELNQQFQSYEMSLRNFGEIWAGAQRRRDNFWEAYNKTFLIYKTLLKKISKEYVVANQPVMDMLANREIST